MKRPWVVLSAAFLSAGLVAGCATANSVKSAQASFEKAKAAGAEAKAPYEYYAAEAYLNQANHETNEGDNQQAAVFAKESETYSAKAIEKAGGGAK